MRRIVSGSWQRMWQPSCKLRPGWLLAWKLKNKMQKKKERQLGVGVALASSCCCGFVGISLCFVLVYAAHVKVASAGSSKLRAGGVNLITEQKSSSRSRHNSACHNYCQAVAFLYCHAMWLLAHKIALCCRVQKSCWQDKQTNKSTRRWPRATNCS